MLCNHGEAASPLTTELHSVLTLDLFFKLAINETETLPDICFQ